jgi:peptidylprolyl isomerase
MIPGFIEGLEKLSFGDKVLFIPSHLAYAGGGDVILLILILCLK